MSIFWASLFTIGENEIVIADDERPEILSMQSDGQP